MAKEKNNNIDILLALEAELKANKRELAANNAKVAKLEAELALRAKARDAKIEEDSKKLNEALERLDKKEKLLDKKINEVNIKANEAESKANEARTLVKAEVKNVESLRFKVDADDEKLNKAIKDCKKVCDELREVAAKVTPERIIKLIKDKL